MTGFSVIQGANEVIGCETYAVSRQSAPVRIDAGDDGAIVIAFNLDEPFRRPDGSAVKPSFDDAAVSPADTPLAPKVRPIGKHGLWVEYFLIPLGEQEPLPDGTGRSGHLAYQFTFRVLKPSTGRRTEAPARFDWLGPQRPIIPAMTAPIVDVAQLSWEQREALHHANPFFAPPRKFARSHEAG